MTTREVVSGEASTSGDRGPTRLRLAPQWDATATYELLDRDAAGVEANAEAEPVFVGRSELLGALETAIGQPDRRGTYLISGYRGSGKTSLLVQSARRARRQLAQQEPPHELLMLVLNVSEVSASLSDGDDAGEESLRIDARRLLTSLLRAIRNSEPIRAAERVPVRPSGRRWTWRWRRRWRREVANSAPQPELVRQVVDALNKAEAATYQRSDVQRSDTTVTRTLEARQSIEVVNVLRLIGAAAVVAAILLGTWIAVKDVAAMVWAVVAVLSGAAVVSFQRSITLKRVASAQNAAEVQIAFDNSLQQLEADLRAILQELAKKWRTVVVLEELDKIDDEEGKQLDAVIRYFKNLFTQAPALFFFLTDKRYFDLVERRIDAARRRRTYAVEHTFFTHRVFVGRPPAADCLEFLRLAMPEVAAQEAIKEIVQTDDRRVRPLHLMTPPERFVRVVLFRAQDHLFDLKNELRRYVVNEPTSGRRNDGGPVLVFDERTFPEDEQALAAFQFLLEKTARTFRFGGARDYQNEILRNCLSAVFSELGSTAEQRVATFCPAAAPRSGSPTRWAGVAEMDGPGDQLTLDERAQIIRAVTQLVGELLKGDAIDPSDVPNLDAPSSNDVATFRWRQSAAQGFKPAGALSASEWVLRDRLLQLGRTVAQFGSSAPLGSIFDQRPAPDEGEVADETPGEMAERLIGAARAIDPSARVLTEDEIEQQRRTAEVSTATLIESVQGLHAARLRRQFGIEMEEVTGARRDGVLVVSPRGSADPAQVRSGIGPLSSDARVLLVYGTDEANTGVVQRLASSPDVPVSNVAIVVVDADPHVSTDRSKRSAWTGVLTGTSWEGRASIFIVPLGEGLEPDEVQSDWGRRTADTLLYGSCWVHQVQWLEPEILGSVARAGREFRIAANQQPSLTPLIHEWLRQPEATLSTTSPSVTLGSLQRAAVGAGSMTMPVVVLPPAVDGAVERRLSSLVAAPLGVDTVLLGSDETKAGGGGKMTRRLWKHGRGDRGGVAELTASDDPPPAG